MAMEIVLNDLSLQTQADSVHIARRWMLDFIETAREATELGVKPVIRTSENFYATVLAPGYSLSDWLIDNYVDRDDQRFILISAKVPFNADLQDNEIEDKQLLSEFFHVGEPAQGLGFAYLIDALAVSLLSEPRWNCSRLELEVRQLDENEDLIDERVEIVHASRSSHVQEHTNCINKRIRSKVRDGLELWNRKDELLPSLEFCESVVKQLQSIRAGNLELQPVVKALFELESYCKNWKTGAFSLEGYVIEASRESQPTLNKYGKQRTFRCLDGKERLFDWHIKLRLCNWRIHFFPDLGPGKIIIGYVGRHLPTVSDPT